MIFRKKNPRKRVKNKFDCQLERMKRKEKKQLQQPKYSLTTNDVTHKHLKMYQNQNALNVNWVLCDARSNQLRPF